MLLVLLLLLFVFFAILTISQDFINDFEIEFIYFYFYQYSRASIPFYQSYVRLVSHWMLVEGVSTQMEAVRDGFNSVFPISSLQMFYPDELDQIFCGTVQSFSAWDTKVCSFIIKIIHK